MKILHIISGNFSQGGAERLVVDLAKAQAEMGHDITICCFRNKSETTYDIDNKVKFYSFNKKKGFSFLLSFKIASFIKKNRFDVVNCHLPAVFMYIICAMIVCQKQKFFYTIHSNSLGEEKRGWVKKVRKVFFNSKRVIPIAISQQIKSEFENLYGVKGIPLVFNGRSTLQKTKKFENVFNEIESYKNNKNTKVLISVGRVTEEKNHKLLVEVMNNLIDEDVILLIIGKINNDEIWSVCEQLNKGKTYFLGLKSNVQDYLFCANIFCMSSIYEGFPIAIIEAMSVGLPIVTTKVGGIPDIVEDGINGFLANDLDVQTYLAALNKALLLPVFKNKIISEQNKLDFKQKYNIEIIAKSYIYYYTC